MEPCFTLEGGGLWGQDWNVTAECQTLYPDGIIRDSTKAAPHKSASSDPENRTQQERKQTVMR